MSSSNRTVRSSSLNPANKTMKTPSDNKLPLKQNSTLKTTVKKTSGIARKTDSSSKVLSENKENNNSNLITRITKLEENFESLKKELQKIVHLENLIQTLMPTLESLQNDMKNVKEDISKVESNSNQTIKTVENFVKSQSRENALIFPFKTNQNVNTNVLQFTSTQKNKEGVDESNLNTITPQKKGSETSLLNRTPKIGDFGISATTLANLPKSSRHKSLSSATVIANLYKFQGSKVNSQNDIPLEDSNRTKTEIDNGSFSHILGSINSRKSIASTKAVESEQEENDSIFPLMVPVAEEELGPVKFLLGVIDRNKLNSIIRKMNDYIKDQGFDHGNYIKCIKQEDLMNQCRLNEKQAKLIIHILCKLMRLEMKSESEYKILSGTTIRKM